MINGRLLVKFANSLFQLYSVFESSTNIQNTIMNVFHSKMEEILFEDVLKTISSVGKYCNSYAV